MGNAANDGKGITEEIAKEFLDGIDVITSGKSYLG